MAEILPPGAQMETRLKTGIIHLRSGLQAREGRVCVCVSVGERHIPPRPTSSSSESPGAAHAPLWWCRGVSTTVGPQQTEDHKMASQQLSLRALALVFLLFALQGELSFFLSSLLRGFHLPLSTLSVYFRVGRLIARWRLGDLSLFQTKHVSLRAFCSASNCFHLYITRMQPVAD